MKWYVNGRLDHVTRARGKLAGSPYKIKLGKAGKGKTPFGYFKGYMAQVSVWKRTLSHSEIIKIASKRKLNPRSKGLVLYLPMCGRKVLDKSKNHFQVLQNGSTKTSRLVHSNLYSKRRIGFKVVSKKHRRMAAREKIIILRYKLRARKLISNYKSCLLNKKI